MLLSIGELIDKLIIENIKISALKERINSEKLVESDEEYVKIYQKMMDLNTNRSIITKELDNKIDGVFNGEPNSILKSIKTYG